MSLTKAACFRGHNNYFVYITLYWQKVFNMHKE
jgi:hypothetical protein